MSSVLYAELKKLKNTRVVWFALAAALPGILLTLADLLPKITPAGTDMQEMFYHQGMMLVMMAPSMFGLMTAYIVAREYQERTINQLFTYPVSRATFLAAKLSMVFLLIAATAVLSFVFVAGCTLLFKHYIDVDAIWLGLGMNAMICVLSFGTIPVAAALSMVAESVVPATVLGSVATVITAIGEIGHGRAGILFPWLAPYWPVRYLAQGIANNTGPNPYVPAALVILALTFVVSLIFCIVYYARADVHSGL